MDSHVDSGMNPIKMAEKIHQIVNLKQPIVHYKVGAFMVVSMREALLSLGRELCIKVQYKHVSLWVREGQGSRYEDWDIGAEHCRPKFSDGSN